MLRVVLSLCLLSVLVVLGTSSATSAAHSTCTPHCTIPAGYTSDICTWYSEATTLSWLPTGYAAAAQCVCQGSSDSVWETPTAQCVRKQVRVNTGLIDPVVMGELYSLKLTDCGLIYCSDRYYEYVIANFIPLIYQIHVNAYKDCCCPGMPASAANFSALVLGYTGFYPCDLVVDAVELTAPCGCQGW